VDGGAKTQILAQVQGSECDAICSIRKGVHQVTQLQKCQTNMGILAATYEGKSLVKRNKLSLLTCKYELFYMEQTKYVWTLSNHS